MQHHLKNAKRIAILLDSKFSFLGFRFGLDSIIGLIPGFGDVVTLFLAGYLVWIGYKSNIPGGKLLRMVINVSADFLIGSIPVVGDIADFFLKANLKNLEILEEHFRTQDSAKK